MITKQEWKKIRGSKASPDQIMLSIKGDAAHSMTVRWRTDTSVSSGYALFKSSGETEWHRVDAQFIDFETDMDENRFFYADMGGLSADTQYEYTCGDDENRSEAYTFKTSKENAEKFINFMQKPEIAAANFEYLYYATPNQAAYDEYLDEDVKNNNFIFPEDEYLDKCYVFTNFSDEVYSYMQEQFVKIQAD